MVEPNDTGELYEAWLIGYEDGKRKEPRNPPAEGDARRVYALAYKLGMRTKNERKGGEL